MAKVAICTETFNDIDFTMMNAFLKENLSNLIRPTFVSKWMSMFHLTIQFETTVGITSTVAPSIVQCSWSQRSNHTRATRLHSSTMLAVFSVSIKHCCHQLEFLPTEFGACSFKFGEQEFQLVPVKCGNCKSVRQALFLGQTYLNIHRLKDQDVR